MERRDYLKTAGGIGATALLGGAGLMAMSGGAAAASGDLTISSTSISNDEGDVTAIGVAFGHTVTWDGFDFPVEAAAYEDYIVQLRSDGSEYARHKLYDNTENPVMLENWSADGKSEGWGGAGEHTSGPGTEGNVNADIDWTVISETPSKDGGTESPGDAADFALDNPNDGSNKKRYFVYEKRVHLYGTRDNGATAVSAADGTTVYPLGEDDGTVGMVESTGRFGVTVGNEGATTSGSSTDGSSSAE